MRLRIVRILITATSLISLSLPTSARVAASSGLTTVPPLRSDAEPRDMRVQAALLRSLMVERHALIQRLVELDAQRGQLLTLASLGAADAILSGDAAALRHAIDATSKAAHRRRSAVHMVLWLTPAAPGALWSPLAQALAPGPLSWTPPAITASPAPLQEPLSLPLALALTAWPAFPRLRATRPPPSAPRTAAVSSYLLPISAPAQSAAGPAVLTRPEGRASVSVRPSSRSFRAGEAGAASRRQDASLGDPLFGAPSHGRLVVDAGDGAVPIAAANATVAAAALMPAVTPRPHARQMRGARPRPERPPTLAALRRRWQAVTIALNQVRALEAWAQTTAPTPVMTPNDLIPSPDALHQRLDYWTAFPALDTPPGERELTGTYLAGNPLTSSARPAASLGRMHDTSTAGRSAGTAPTATTVPPAMESPAMAIWRWEHSGYAPVLPRVAPSPRAAAGRPSVTAPAEALGATLALTVGGKVAGVAISSTLAAHGRAGVSVSSISDSDTAATHLAASALDVPVALSPLPTPAVAASIGARDRRISRVRGAPHDAGGVHTPITPTATVTGTAAPGPISTERLPPSHFVGRAAHPTLAAATSTQTGTGHVAASPDASPTGPSTFTPQSSSMPTPAAGQGYSQSGTAVPGATALVSATTPLPPVRHITVPVSLDVAVAGATPALTITTALSATPPLTPAEGGSKSLRLVVTLPVTAARVLAPAGFSSRRVALERVLRQGEALYAQMQAGEQALEQSYRARLREVANLNTAIENRWYARYQAYRTYQHTFPRYERRMAAFNAYAHRLHLARLRHAQWRKRLAAWTRYARAMAAYNVALAARRQAPAIPISSTGSLTPTARAPLPRKPVMPPFPGPEPPPFRQPPPPWPGSRPVYSANPGPEPAGYPLPLPPEAVPPWDGVAVPLTALRYGGLALGVGAAGREETTQNALLAAGAFDGIGAYQDPIKGVITTYWGGHTIFQSFHTGIDIAAPLYTPIHAAAAGKVTWAGYAAPGQRHYSYGLCVIIQHNAHFSTLYAHLDDQKYGLQVRVGDIVQQGQVIGHEGMTGWTTGPHLHFEIRQDNVQVNPLLLIPKPQD